MDWFSLWRPAPPPTGAPQRPVLLLKSVFGSSRPPVLFFGYPPKCGAGARDERRTLTEADFRTAKSGPPSMYFSHGGDVHAYNSVLNTLENAGMCETGHDGMRWSLHWGGCPKPALLREFHPLQKTNHFPASWQLGRKDLMWRNIRNMQRRWGKQFDITPASFVLPGGWASWEAAREQELGAVLRLTMRFLNADTERHFVELHADMLARNVFWGSLASTAAFFIVMASLASRELTGVNAESTWRLNFITAATCMCTSIVVAISAKMPCVLRLLTPQMREVVVVTLMLILAALQFALDPWYGAKILQHEPDPCDCQQGHFSDTRLVLVLSILMVASHFALPIRWVCLLPFEIALGLLYAGFAFILGGSDGAQAWSTFLLFQGLIMCAIIGRRTIEDHQRESFCTIINERSLRVQSEFELEQRHGLTPQSGANVKRAHFASEAMSRPETTPSCLAFEEQDEHQSFASLNKLIDLGHREQWYVKSNELKLHEEVLGKGCYGVVLAGEYHGSRVAVKVSKLAMREEDHLSEKDRIMSSLNEVRIMRRLCHPGIALLHGARLDAGHDNIAIVLEHISGKTLEEMIHEGSPKKEQLQPFDRLRALVQISCALRYLHSREPPIVHGDLKASNIMAEHVPGLSGFHRMKLLDFGLARALTRHAMPLGGTLIWMAPELVLSPGHRPQVSADVYSFGRLAFFVLTSTMALAHGTREEIIECMKKQDLPALPWPPNLEPTLASYRDHVEHCLEFQADARPSMEMVGSSFQSKFNESFSEATGACTSDCQATCSSHAQLLSVPLAANDSCSDPFGISDSSSSIGNARQVQRSSVPHSLNTMPIIPGMLEVSAHSSPAVPGHHFPVLPDTA